MYLSELKIWNFRKYSINGSNKIELAEPGLKVKFKKGVNVLVGENDSGKTAIIDAIRYVLKTQSQEFIQLEDKDFYKEKDGDRSQELKIECTFSDFSPADAGHFLEWIGFDDNGKYKLKIWLTAKRKDNHIYPKVSAGVNVDGTYMEGEARDLLRVIYLKPLRDALTDMTHGRKSRLAQILKNLKAFKNEPNEHGGRKLHELEKQHDLYSEKVGDYFKDDKKGKKITKTINGFLTDDFLFKDEDRQAGLKIDKDELGEILRDLDLVLEENKSGLGSLNLLCMAAELLYLKEKKTGLKLTLIEELEAHLHPQYQLRMIDFIEKKQDKYGQFILTTHSTTLASKIDLKNLIICRKKNGIFPMGHKHTQLEEGDYQFLKRFLDATKSNLFFARGVIIVEGDAENLLIPTIAEIIDRPLHEYGVSIVNVGSTAFKRYAKIFLRKGKDENPNEWLDVPVSIITDLDIRSFEYYKEKQEASQPTYFQFTKKAASKLEKYSDQFDCEGLEDLIYTSISNFWEMEKSRKLVPRFKKGVKSAIENVLKDCTITITANIIEGIRKKTYKAKLAEYPKQNVKLFVAGSWTLEYEIAESCIKGDLLNAIECARLLKNDPSISLDEELIDDAQELANAIDDSLVGETPENVAYQIFKPLNDGEVSKAVTAQCLAMLLEKDKESSRQLIEGDLYLKYICDAIYHVTDPVEEGEAYE